jgi:hypothetical protein
MPFTGIYHMVCHLKEYIIWYAIYRNISYGMSFTGIYHMVCHLQAYIIWLSIARDRIMNESIIIKTYISNSNSAHYDLHQVQSQLIRNQNNLKVFESKKTKELKQDSQSRLWLPMTEAGRRETG